ncbi:MAG TPA: 4Fe-4S ferredoxin, partial [Lachnospiraceae bacterium]|nr:4Fe-4S ferredoxin [Lachnospiraceae bacterium]
MEQAKVYFTTFKTTGQENLLQKLHRLMKTAGFEEIDFTDKYAAIKIHFGEYGNLAFLRPNYAKVVADYVKELGGRPFLTDCNTLYVGSRKNALDHLETAYVNGFSPYQTGCHVIIGDGLKGTDEAIVPIDGEYVKEAKIGHAIMDADVFISLTHFKGHEMAGFGGTLKNIGMGCGSRAGKMEQHCDGKPSVGDACVGCGACSRICAHDAPLIQNGKAAIDHDKCVGCGRCLAVCPKDAIHADFSDSIAVLNYKMA